MSEFLRKLFWPITAPIEFIQNHFKALIFLLIAFLIFYPASEGLKEPNLAKVFLRGEISGSEHVLSQLKEAEEKKVKGILFVIDSPGGSVAPSVEISMAIKRIKAKMPVVAYAEGTMASGSYYAGIWANKIVSNPGSSIGSIGIIFESANLEGLLNKLGVKPQVAKVGEFKEAGTPFRSWNKEEKEQIQSLLNDTYKMFITDVAAARKLDVKKSDSFANARIFTAAGAKEVGLIDSLGSVYDAEEELKKLAHVKEPVWYEKDKADKFWERVMSDAITRVVLRIAGLPESK